jgi:hypothetical protein
MTAPLRLALVVTGSDASLSLQSSVTAMYSLHRKNIGHCPFSEAYLIYDANGD